MYKSTQRGDFANARIPRAYDPPPPPPPPGPIPPPPDPFAGLFNSDSEPVGGDKGKSGGPKKPRSDYTYRSWEKFLCQLPHRKSSTAKKIDEEKTIVAQTPGDGLQIEENAFASWEQAASECRAKVAAIVKECNRLNQKYRDTSFDLEWDDYCVKSLDGQYPKGLPVDPLDIPPSFVKRVADVFDKPEFFIDGATASDVHQGASGDCWFLAALMAVGAMKKELIENRLCVARCEKVDVYGFVFFRDGEWIYEIVDGRVFVKIGDNENLTLIKNWNRDKKEGSYVEFSEDRYDELKGQLQRGGEALYFSHCKSSETWLPLIEKAYAKAHGDYYSIEGGFTSEGIEDLTGGVGVIINADEIMDKDRFWKEQMSQVNVKYLFGGSTVSPKKGILSSHAYAVLEAWEEGDLRLLKIRNPWGNCEWEGDWSDGSKLWTSSMIDKLKHTFGDDGIFWMSYKDFLKRFSNINRVRLFSEEWHVSQCWTCVNVPWAVDYLDTKFVFTITEKSSVVIVLSQPDDRYFWALRGRYWYTMHFQVYKEDDSEGDWIVRSMHSSGAEPEFSRSVSAEIEDLEPGTYRVIFKVTADRRPDAPTAEEAILKYAKERKEKLLSVGRRFDYAQSKGNLRAMEKANREGVVLEIRDFNKAMQQKDRKFAKLKNDQARKRKKRISDAMREKRAERRRRRERGPEDDREGSAADDEKSESKTGVTPNTEDSRSKEEGDHKPAAEDDEPKSEPKEGKTISAEEEGSSKPVAEGDGTQSVAEEGDSKPVTGVDDADAPADGRAGEKSTTSKEVVPDEADSPLKESGDAQDIEPKVSGGRGDYREQVDVEDVLSRRFSRLDLGDAPGTPTERRPSMFLPREESCEPPPPIEQLNDDDFEWDSELDDEIYLSDDADDAPVRRFNLTTNNEIFEGDPWNAMCVLGLRVYAQKGTPKVSVVKGQNSS